MTLPIIFAAATGECGKNTTVLDTSCLPHPAASAGSVSTAVNIIFGITASITLLMLVIGGLRYILARGDPSGTAQAKNTLLYAIIGLFVVLTAYAIVTFVVKGVGA